MTPVREITKDIITQISVEKPGPACAIWIAYALCAIAHAIASLRKGPNDYYGQG